MLRKIISGGQIGVDQAGLKVGRKLGIETGGWAPKRFWTKKGPNPKLADYGLVATNTNGYVPRTIMNINEADATIAFRIRPSAGTDKTIGYAVTGRWQNIYTDYGDDGEPVAITDGHSPVLVVHDLSFPYNADRIEQFVKDNEIETLNIAGHGDESIFIEVARILYDGLSKCTANTQAMGNE